MKFFCYGNEFYLRAVLIGNKILYKNLDLTQDFPNKISFHFLWVKMLLKNLPTAKHHSTGGREGVYRSYPRSSADSAPDRGTDTTYAGVV